MRWLLCLIFVVGCAGSQQHSVLHSVWDCGPGPQYRGLGQTIPAIRNHPDEPPFLNGWPEHLARAWLIETIVDSGGVCDTRVSLSGSGPPIDKQSFDPLSAHLRLFEIKKYRAIFHGAEREEFDKRLSDLQAAVHGDAARFPDILPAVEASPAFHVNFSPVCFDGGCGVRAVTMYVQDNNLVENGRLFYTLQGLSNDERYWIAAYWPVQAEGIRMQSHDLSADEIAILNSPELYAEYLSEQIEILEAATYDPPLENIDEIISLQKLEVK